jgi:hypothetical protein
MVISLSTFASYSHLGTSYMSDYENTNDVNRKQRLRNFKASLTGGYFEANDYSFGMGGVSFELFVGRNMSLNYNFNLGITTNQNNYFYYHGPIGASAGTLFLTAALLNNAIDNSLDDALTVATGRSFNLSSKLTKGLGITGVILILIPEGINFNFDIGKHIAISPYINPAGIDFCANNDPLGQQLNLSWEYGGKLNLYFNNRRFLTPKVGIKNFYGSATKGISLGLMYGYYF